MNITFVSADDTIRMTFGIDPWTAVKDLTKIEKELGKDLTDIIQKVLDVSFNVTSPAFTRGPKDAYVVSYSCELQPIIGRHITKDNAVKSISVTVGDSDHSLYEFEDVEDRDIDAMITWLRKEHQVYYTPNDELLNEKKKWATKAAEQQKKIDSYEATLGKLTDIMKPEYAGLTWSETWDDLVERIKRMKENSEGLRKQLENTRDSRSAFCKKLKEALDVDYRYPGSFPKMEEDILWEIKRLKTEHDDARGLSINIEELEEQLRKANEELANHRVAEGWLRKDNSDLAIDVANLKEQLRVLRYDILKVYREIFDCSNGDPEGTDEETMNDILTEYKRTLELKNVAEESLAREREWTRKMGQKLIEIQDICER